MPVNMHTNMTYQVWIFWYFLYKHQLTANEVTDSIYFYAANIHIFCVEFVIGISRFVVVYIIIRIIVLAIVFSIFPIILNKKF